MTPTPPQPPADPEARLTALLLGELSPAEAAAVHAELARDPAQAALLARLARTLPLVREAVRQAPPSSAPGPEEPPRLSPARREALLAAFKTVKPAFAQAPQSKRRRRSEWLALAAVVTVLLGLAGGMLLPALSKAKAKAQYLSAQRVEQERQLARRLEESTPPPPATATPRTVTATPPVREPAATPPPGISPAAAPGARPGDKERPGNDVRMMLRNGIGLSPETVKRLREELERETTSERLEAEMPRSPTPELKFVPTPAAPGMGGAIAGAPIASRPGTRAAPGSRTDVAPSAASVASSPPALGDVLTVGQSLAPPEAAPSARAVPAPVEALGLEAPQTADLLERRRVSLAAPASAVGDEKLADREPVSQPAPQPETVTAENAVSTFSLNVTDVAFKLAAASLAAGQLPDPASIRVEEFINAFDYRDPAPAAGAPVAFHWERARHPLAHARDLVRFSVQTAAQGREPGRALNLVLLLDSSGSMERADRVAIVSEMVRALAGQLQAEDRVSVVTFARQARLRVDGLPGSQAAELPERVGLITPEGGTNLEDALRLGYLIAARHFIPGGVNRVILLTDGAANLGDARPESLRPLVEENRRRGVALDCWGVGWDGYHDALLEALSRHGDGRYGFVNSPAEAATEFVNRLTGALQVAAADVKVQVEFNPARVTRWRQIGYAAHQLTREQFRDDAVDAAELGGAETGTALYVIEVTPRGTGPLGVFRLRYRVPATGVARELAWPLDYTGEAPPLQNASPALRLAATAAMFGEWLAQSPHAIEATPAQLRRWLAGVPEVFDPDPRPRRLETMLLQAEALVGNAR